MLDHLPTTRPGETLYSVLARLCRYMDVKEAGPFMRAVMGRRHAIASPDLPGGLAVLTGASDSEEDAAALDRVIDTLTLFPFHTAFASADARVWVRSAMRGDMTGVHTRLGLAAFRIRPPERLRFCPECLDDMEARGAEPWWRRDHQMPGIPVCPSHGVPLRLSDVAPGSANRHSFIPASRDVCRADAAPAIKASSSDLDRLHRLAVAAAALLNAPPVPAEPEAWNRGYREQLNEVGMMRSACKVDQEALRDAFASHWGEVPNLIEALSLGNDIEGSWLAAMVRAGRRAAHPVQHLMLRGLLDALDPVRRHLPFGSGPWPCRNPVADHHGEQVIEQVALRRDRETLYGDFACSCGYLYTCSRGQDGRVGEPRYRRFGPLLVPALKAAIAKGDGLRATARSLGIDPKTLMREAMMAGVAVPWNLTPSGAVLVTPAPEIQRRSVPARARRPDRHRRNWFAIDTRLARSVRHAAAEIIATTPPVRITLASVEARVARRDWIVKRRAKLPQTMVAIASASEDTDAFRMRRLRWQVQQAVSAGDLRPCGILRAAGLPTGWLDTVRDEIGLALGSDRAAA